jgi:hypothetical protein
MNKINVSNYEGNEYNFDTILKTQPQGDVEVYATYTKLPGGYAQVLYLHDMQATANRNHFLSNLAAEENAILVVSAGVENKDALNKRLDKADVTWWEKIGNRNASSRLSQQHNNEGDAFYVISQSINGDSPEKGLRVYIRLIVFDRTKKKLKQRVRDIKGRYATMQFATLKDFQFDEMRSIWAPAMKQMEFLNENLLGLSMSSADLGGAFWADHVKLSDPDGTFLGTTFTNGIVNFNMYLRDKGFRSRPFGVFLGMPGFGKSTLQKMLLEDSHMRGNRSVVFDPSREYGGITKNVGGVTVSLDGSEGMINPLQAFPTVTKGEDGSEVDAVASFGQHVEKFSAMYGFMSQGLTQHDLSNDRIAIRNLMNRFYIELGMWDSAPLKHPEKIHLFDLPNTSYPRLSEFLRWVKSKSRLQSGDYAEQLPISQDSFNRIIGTMENMVQQHAQMFDGYTTLPDLSGEAFVRYDVGMLLSTPDVFNAQIYSALSLEQANIINNGKKQRLARQRGTIALNEVPHTLLVLDEAQNYITLENAYNLNYVVKLMEQMRKNYAALMMAMPTIKDLVVTDSNTPDPQAKAFYRDVKKLFDLMQYRFFFNLSNADIDPLSFVMGDSITPAEMHQIPRLSKGEALLNIQGDRNILMNVQPTRKQLARFNGGD